MRVLLAAIAGVILGTTAWAVDCPKWIGLQGTNVLAYCNEASVTKYLALADSAGVVPGVVTLTAVYAPLALAVATSRCDAVPVVGIIAGKTVYANPGANPNTGHVIASYRISGLNTVTVCWRNTAAAGVATVPMASSTWNFVQLP